MLTRSRTQDSGYVTSGPEFGNVLRIAARAEFVYLLMEPHRNDDKLKVWVHRAQIPLGVAGLALGVFEVVEGYLVLGIFVAVIATSAAAIAVSRLRR
jgi:hypothetical protein